MSGRNPPLYCTFTLIAMQGHQKNIRSKPETVWYTITHGSSNIHYKGYKYKATTRYLTGFPTGLVVTLGQQYNVGEKPTVILYTYIIITMHSHPSYPNLTTVIYSYEYSEAANIKPLPGILKQVILITMRNPQSHPDIT